MFSHHVVAEFVDIAHHLGQRGRLQDKCRATPQHCSGNIAVAHRAAELAAQGDAPSPELRTRVRDPISLALSYGSGLVLVAILAVIASLAAIRRVLRLDPVEATMPMGATR